VMLVHRRLLSGNLSVRGPQQFADTLLFTRVERSSVRAKCLAQEHNTITMARAPSLTHWSKYPMFKIRHSVIDNVNFEFYGYFNHCQLLKELVVYFATSSVNLEPPFERSPKLTKAVPVGISS